MHKAFFLFFFMMAFLFGNAQCTLNLSGRVVDEGTEEGLFNAAVLILELNQGQVTDSTGYFLFQDLCPGEYHVSISHAGCAEKVLFLNLQASKDLHVHLQHHVELLNEVVVHAEGGGYAASQSKTIGTETIANTGGEGLAAVLETTPGVRSLKVGSQIGKPQINGLSGPRVQFLDNGLPLSTQDWGRDHAPELDPFTADHISVVQGASTLAYSTQATGGVVLLEADPIGQDPHLHGATRTWFATNGREMGANTRLQWFDGKQGWRANATYSRAGDAHSPTYFLTNTGAENLSIKLSHDRAWSPRLATRSSYAFLKNQAGVLLGAHLSNLSDLELAFDRDEPYLTSDAFSYSIQNPRQEVVHHSLNMKSTFFITDEIQWINQLGTQINAREEFDPRRGSLKDVPALSLVRFNQFLESKFIINLDGKKTRNFGLRFDFTDNTNQPETGVLPLIPDFNALILSSYFIQKEEGGDFWLEYGLRSDLRWMSAKVISRDFPRRILSYQPQNLNLAAALSLGKRGQSKFSWAFDVRGVRRAPEVHEWFSFGLHQGVGSLEEGNPNLDPETSVQALLNLQYRYSKKGLFRFNLNQQYFLNFINLQPTGDVRLTVRGAFPVFAYEQYRAHIQSADIGWTQTWTSGYKLSLNHNRILGQNLDSVSFIPYMPPGQTKVNFQREFKALGSLQKPIIGLEWTFTEEQSQFELDQDFIPPPSAYHLVNLRLGVERGLGNGVFSFQVQVQNLFNTSYRDYLNRLRYFADETGRNVRIQLNYRF